MLKRQAILFVDGYNMIGAWPHLASLMKQDELEKARDRLIFDLSQYKKMSDFAKVVVVFDAYQVPGVTKNFDQFDLTVVFTKEGETADAYIEREIAQYLSPVYRLIVATSDAAEQWLIFQKGAYRQSAQELLLALHYQQQAAYKQIEAHHNNKIRRRNPWTMEDLISLNRLRQDIEDSTTK